MLFSAVLIIDDIASRAAKAAIGPNYCPSAQGKAMSNRSPTLLLLFLLGCSNVANAASGQSSATAADALDCEQLAELPDAPVSVAQCRAMMGMTQDDPQTHRPGDEAMTCNEIFAELGTMQGEGVSETNAAQTEVLVAEGRELSARHTAEMARQATPSPLALASSLLPNAVGAALMAPEYARKMAATRQLKAEDESYAAQLGQQMTASSTDFSQLVQANPRLPRLSQLAMDKNCQPPAD